MNKAKNEEFRVVIFKDGETFVAQCLEHDICSQASDMKSLRHRMDAAIEAELEHARSAGKQLAECVSPAPKHLHDMWEKAWGAMQEDATRMRLALCA